MALLCDILKRGAGRALLSVFLDRYMRERERFKLIFLD